MATLFDAVIPVVLQHEGGYVNDPDDRGGATNFGITQRTLDSYQEPKKSDVRDLTVEKATEIYRAMFWDGLQLDRVTSFPLALVLMDQAVLDGQTGAVARMQSVLGIQSDGAIGPRTIDAMNVATVARRDTRIAFDFLRFSSHYYTALIKRRPEQVKFLEGWEERLFSLAEIIFFGR